jgi:hypothetical protein
MLSMYYVASGKQYLTTNAVEVKPYCVWKIIGDDSRKESSTSSNDKCIVTMEAY